MKISVIIPTYNEESTIDKTLGDLITKHEAEEVIVVDGRSVDRTVSLAKQWATVLHSEKGRASQMNKGAWAATGDIFLFLHADTRLPDRGLTLVQEAVANGAQGGRFRMRFDRRNWLLRIYESYTRFQFFSYGDQGFFVRRDLFEELGGFREDAPFEDIDFYQRLRKVTKPVIIKESVTTSARRFISRGCLTQKLINIWLIGLSYLGINVLTTKEKLYPDIRT